MYHPETFTPLPWKSRQSSPPNRRVVVTGMGVVAPNGDTLESFWQSLVDGDSPIRRLTRFDPGKIPCRYAAEIDGFDAGDFIDRKLARKLDRSNALGMVAAVKAHRDAGLDLGVADPDRAGILEGTSLSNVETAYKGRANFDKKGYRAVSPSAMINGHFGSGSAEIALHLGFKGCAMSSSTSSSSGNDVLGAAHAAIQSDEADIMLAGGSEAPIIDTVWTGFCQMRAMSRRDGDPVRAMRPFDRESDGFVLGEGAAYLVLEELSHALGRNAGIYAEVAAYGRCSEAHHSMAPDEGGYGVRRCLEKAFLSSRIPMDEIDAVNAHGTANRPSDAAECAAIRAFFGERAGRIAISSTKPVTGHSLSAVGAIEAVACVLSLRHACIPPTLNLEEPIDKELDFVVGQPRPYPLRGIVNLNSGFGGKNSCIVFRQWNGGGTP